MRTNGEFDREIDARRNNTALRTVASSSLSEKQCSKRDSSSTKSIIPITILLEPISHQRIRQ